MKTSIFALPFLLLGCTKTECIADDGCDTGADPIVESGPVSVQFEWVTAAAFQVTVSGSSSARLGIAETGLAGTGYYLEDCVSPGSVCHPLSEGTNTFESQHQTATGVPWDGTLDEGETALHRESEENLTYAVWTDGNDDCVAVEGHDVTYYESHGCVNIGR